MLSTLFLKRLISFFALLVSLLSFSFALAVDSDGDGVDDIQDAFPEDASRQYLSFDEALGEIEDPNLRRCIEERQNGAETAGGTSLLRLQPLRCGLPIGDRALYRTGTALPGIP